MIEIAIFELRQWNRLQRLQNRFLLSPCSGYEREEHSCQNHYCRFFHLIPPVLRNKTAVTETIMECDTHINQDEHEMRIKRTLKTIRAIVCAIMLRSVRNLGPASGTNREHQHTRNNKTTHQVPEPGAEVMSAANQITHHQRSNKAAKISDGVDQPDRGSRGRLT